MEERSIPSAGQPYWQMPELAEDDRLIGGVAAGIGRELGLEPIWVRIGFVVLFAMGGWGALLYGAAWALFALAGRHSTPGGRAAPAERIAKGKTASARLAGFAVTVAGLAILAGRIGGFPAEVVWPLGVLGVGLLVAWQRLSGDTDEDWRSPRRWLVVVGNLLVATVAVIVLLLGIEGVADAAGSVLLALGAVVAMAGLSAPWWWRLVRERDAERQARARSDERAEVAAHLHDSVLQTLTLIQRNSADPQAMLNLARRQERELRNWLDPNRASRHGESVRGCLDEIATTVEELHGVPVEVVAVGDCLVDEPVDALLGATREATVNAAKHSGAEQIDIYLEVGEDGIEVYVRDTGKGFETDVIDEDRHGIRHSILARMERAGGTAVVTSAPGEGTEVELRLGQETNR
ncbi:MAG: PspC domain-containing protein [Acidimicrobiia bacterium]|nr:PspC domain-containing protein [Acidimicrobiia bacterium]